MYKPNTLSLVTTYHCTASCEHCCFKCSPKRRERMSGDDLVNYIQQAKDVGSIKLIVFTGGECFTLGEDLLEAIRCAKKLGLFTRCVSNGYWASTNASAKRMVKRTLDAGLSEMNFSTGDNHSEHVPIEHVLTAVRLYCEAGISTVVNMELMENSRTGAILKSVMRSWKKRYPNLVANYGLWIPNGGKGRPRHSDFFQWKNKSDLFRGCNSLLSSLSVDPSGKVEACCGLYCQYIKDLAVGNLKSDTLADVVRRLNEKEDALKIMIAVEGPEAVLTYAKKYNPSISIKGHYVHPCQTCLLVYKRKRYRPAIEKACAEHMERIYGTYRTANAMHDVIMGIN